MAGSIWAIVIPRNAKQAPHTEERLPEGNGEPAGETAARGRRLYWISAPVNPPVMDDAHYRTRKRGALSNKRAGLLGLVT
jgi:hypothetical protein